MNASRGSLYNHFNLKEEAFLVLSKQNPYDHIFSEVKSLKGVSCLDKLIRILIYLLNESFSKENINFAQ